MTGDILRRKWRNKRDAYKKNKRLLETKKSGSCASKVTKIMFYDQLSFLDPYIADRSTVSNLPQRQSEPLFSEEEEADGDEEDISPILPTSDEEHSDLESALSSNAMRVVPPLLEVCSDLHPVCRGLWHAHNNWLQGLPNGWQNTPQ
ncbi:uncharacterized protein LOC121390400 isoform X3 [Gigantopelta aegis]|uniref:uncharacterized protein LOC121390400 isoform X3 n=1 Tax=Gigantopelta aegis TaxID=1735272 RepID=UPI001B88E59A|nr:uncharacterized protein LOC121390400 isoform X3 [Gigantopelta aegis]